MNSDELMFSPTTAQFSCLDPSYPMGDNDNWEDVDLDVTDETIKVTLNTLRG